MQTITALLHPGADADAIHHAARRHSLSCAADHNGNLRLSGAPHDVAAFAKANAPSDANGVQSLLGVDPAPAARHPAPLRGKAKTPARSPRFVPWLAQRYGFPDKATGAGQRVALVLAGGGLDQRGLDTYFHTVGVPCPALEIVEVDGAKNAPADREAMRASLLSMGIGKPGAPGHPSKYTPSGPTVTPSADVLWTYEASLDVQIAGAAAYGASLTVYVTDGQPHGLYTALAKAAADGATAVSGSFGWHEQDATDAVQAALDHGLKGLAAKGIPAFFGSGDWGGFAGDQPALYYPASHPLAVGVGGTRAGKAEAVWNEDDFGVMGASGGGYSRLFKRPAWQTGLPGAHTRWRGVPDVAANAAASTPCWLYVAGLNCVSMGTSASTPLWAALAARLAEAGGREVLQGWPGALYGAAARATFTDVTQGDNKYNGNRGYSARSGWDPCTGLGVPDGAALLAALSKSHCP